jgi:hypothetical protein
MYVKPRPQRSRWDCDACGWPAETHDQHHLRGVASPVSSCRAYTRTWWHRFLDWASW